MQVTMGTSPTESMTAAGNIFLGQVNNSLESQQQTNNSVVDTIIISIIILQIHYSHINLISLFQTEAPLLIAPYIAELTRSEIHAVMTGGLAGISGTILGAYISFGVRRRMQGRTVYTWGYHS